MGNFMNSGGDGMGGGRDDDVRSVSLSELNDADRISEISSLNENEIGDQDLSFDNNKGGFKRPNMGIRANNREALINRLKGKKKKNSGGGGGGGSGGVTIDL